MLKPSLARKYTQLGGMLSVLILAPLAHGQDGPSPNDPAPADATTAGPSAVANSKPAAEVQPPKDPDRSVSLEPQLAEPPPVGRATFDVDPIADTGIIVLASGFALVLELINSTGEIRPQQIAPDFKPQNLIGIDRASITAKPSASAGSLSNLGLGAAVAFALVDPFVSGLREHSVQTGLVDAMLYAESASLTLGFTDMVKLAVRRPRPGAYIDAHGDPDYQNPNTDSALSFFSGHASMTATIGATATYLAFTRSPHTARPWITFAIATAATAFVSVERVQAGKHFPTDVLAGAVAGAGIGVIVPHLHRTEDVKQRRVWVGFAPAAEQSIAHGGSLLCSGTF
jgi:membrane-associated phospholipid phosphatase